MPLGDSITGSPGCWRALLWQNLVNTGYSNIDFVGTLPPQGCGFPYDGDNEGHGGILATNMANQNQLPPWLSATNPDIVIMHLGTNDVWNNLSPTTILAAFSTLVSQMRANNPNMKILVAQIIPMNPSNCTACAQRVIDLNAAIPAWAASVTTAQSPVIVVDQWTGFNDSTDTVDGVHPNDSGNQKMAAKWYPPLTAQLNTFFTPTPPTGTPSVPTPTATPSGPTPTPTHVSSTPTPPPTATPAPPTSTPTSGSNGVTASGVVASNSPWFGEEDIKFSNTSPITSLTATITVQKTAGVSYNGSYVTFGGATLAHTDNGSTIVYTFTLNSGQTLSPSSNLITAAQFGGTGTAHSTTGDLWSITTTSGGVTNAINGHF